MYQCQLRIPNCLSLDQWLDLIAEKTWLLFLHQIQIDKIPNSAYQQFHARLIDIISPFLKAYSLCGTSDICNESVGSRPVQLDSRIRHLNLPFSFANLIEEIAHRMAASLDKKLLVKQPEELIGDLRIILHSVLGEYVQYDQWCGRAQICRYSIPIDPWQHETHLRRE